MNKTINEILKIKNKYKNINIREINIQNNKVYILYIQQLTDRNMLIENIIKPIVSYQNDNFNVEEIVNSVLYIDDLKIDNTSEEIFNYVLSGKSVIAIENNINYIIANTFKVEKRPTQPPLIETTLRGAKDCFTENYSDNLSLIRYRIKDKSLKIENYTIGKRSKTKIGIVYMSNIANDNLVKIVKNKIRKINVDGVFESSHIQNLIINNAYNLFPQTGIVERSDTACANLIEGRILLIVEGSSLPLIIPKTFPEFIDASDDHYENIYNSIFSKILRAICFLISLLLSSLYVAIVSYHSDILPPQYILTLAVSRATVPFNAVLEATLMELVAEILREASIRLPKQIGPAIGIVGTIVIGQAAVTAGLVSPLLVIIVSLSIMSSFAAGDYTITNPVRILKFFMIFITAILGLFGFTIGLSFILINLCSINSFGVPYTSPFSPFSFNDMKNLIFSNINIGKTRPQHIKPKDKTRQKK